MSFVENFITTSMAALVTGVLLIGFSQSKTGEAVGEVLGAKIDSIAERVLSGNK